MLSFGRISDKHFLTRNLGQKGIKTYIYQAK